MEMTRKEILAQLERLSKKDLDNIVAELMNVTYFPIGTDEVTVKDFHPYLTDEELDYVMSKYTGTMKRG